MDVKKIREKYGITQSQLADKLGITLRTVQNWENGKVIPPAMLKLLESIDIGETVSSVNFSDNGMSVAAGKGSQVTLNPDTERFFSTLEKQQEIMSRQLEEMAAMRKQAQKKDEQIDVLLDMLKTKMEAKE